MRKLWTWVAAASFAVGQMASAGDNPVVVELFTSQGCSSCPPADALLAELGARDDVIPLALHVDYWDYIGWKDKFASPAFTTRQRGYARTNGWRTIYTPQMVINGKDDVVGSRPMKLAEIIQRHAMKPDVVDLDLSRDGNRLRIQAKALSRIPNAEVVVVRYMPEVGVRIARGENAGRTLRYTHIVHGWSGVGRWAGNSDLDKTVTVNGEGPVVVLIQEPRQGQILAAARLR